MVELFAGSLRSPPSRRSLRIAWLVHRLAGLDGTLAAEGGEGDLARGLMSERLASANTSTQPSRAER